MVKQFKWIEIVLPKYLARRVDVGNSPIRLARKSNNLLRNRIAIRTSRLNGKRERRLKIPKLSCGFSVPKTTFFSVSVPTHTEGL
jgi:hypothetical protein